MVLKLDKEWVWDSWYAHDGERWHGFVLKADRSLGDPELRHSNVSQGHAVSDDLTNWEYLGTSFRPAPPPAWDDAATWTGSVVRGPDGLWHLFYTGAGSAESGLYQRIGHATSVDLHHWRRVGDGLCLDLAGPAADRYEAEHMVGHWHDRAMRDPWVMKDPSGDGWLMYFTARVPDATEPNEGGAIGLATSPDLVDWTLQPPVYAGGFGQLEVPQVFEVDGRWYCLFCTAAHHWSRARMAAAGVPPVTGNHYLMADDPRGPWQPAPGFFDGGEPCRRYAARILETEAGLVIIGFDHDSPEGFEGYLRDPEPVTVDDLGLLHVTPEKLAAE